VVAYFSLAIGIGLSFLHAGRISIFAAPLTGLVWR